MDYILSKEAPVKLRQWPRNTLAAGPRHTIGLKTDGTVVAAGQDY